MEIPEPFPSTYHLYTSDGHLHSAVKANYELALTLPKKRERAIEAQKHLLELERAEKQKQIGKSEFDKELELYRDDMIESVLQIKGKKPLEEAEENYHKAFAEYEQAIVAKQKYLEKLDWYNWCRGLDYEDTVDHAQWLQDRNKNPSFFVLHPDDRWPLVNLIIGAVGTAAMGIFITPPLFLITLFFLFCIYMVVTDGTSDACN